MFIIKHRGKIALLLIGLGIFIVILLPNLIGFIIGPMFIVMALLLFTIRGAHFLGGDDTHPDRVYGPITRVMMGVGLGVLAALLVVFVPEQLFLPVMILVLAAASAYAIYEIRRNR